ncbi:UbiX family flavin prenyltransferase [Ornithinimicrobium cavernae]|uniref:UbiX family flavin prenyltransferase n=1 Tax=Ornithinimicrobium cavernae TaxID=2666047 RepID=UPI00192A6BF6|nr:UbiX family flavin prenyltransferase [Ornithinimicrobium cavernae]
MTTRRMIIGITGASGVTYGVRLLEELRVLGIETHLVLSKAAHLTIDHELDISVRQVKELADVVHPVHDVAASISSGSFPTMGMIIAPCSVRSLAEVATGVTTTLLSRAADVTLKERRRLTLLVRETPLSLVHIRNMAAVTEMGGVIFPPLPSFYTAPNSIEDLVDGTVGRVLDLYGLDSQITPRWEGTPPPRYPKGITS